MRTRIRRGIAGLPVAILVGAALNARAVEPEMPQLCRDAVAEKPGEPLVALRAAEAKHWRAARRAGKAAQREMSRSLAVGPGAAPGMSARVEVASAEYFGSIRLAKVLCGCRLELGDAEPDECARRYPVQ
ncbi:MAG: hypothetical protein OEP95_11605 [Myxococcales bacterium]|nr:hypothetical protein [Myxococcales bacterium]